MSSLSCGAFNCGFEDAPNDTADETAEFDPDGVSVEEIYGKEGAGGPDVAVAGWDHALRTAAAGGDRDTWSDDEPGTPDEISSTSDARAPLRDELGAD